MTEERYEIRGKLGQGGLGAVYRAYDKNLNREVAIKRVLPDGEADDQDEATSSLLKEAKALSAIQHPHIVTVYDCGLDEDGPFVVMEILEGRTIEEMVGQGTLVWEDFREVVMQTQEALIAAQDLDLVHRDLKPGNIMVIWLPSGKFQIKLVDFGLAKFSPTPSLQTMDHGHAVFGSIYFMAPEQFERRPLDQRTDMYAMGSIYYYTLTGEYPFDGDTAPQVMAAHLQHKVTPLSELRPDVPDWACEWVMWHIERDMDNRPSNARESLQRFLALEKQANGSSAPAGATGPQFVQPGTSPVNATGPNSGRVQLRTGPVAVNPPQGNVTGPVVTAPANTAPVQTQTVTNTPAPGGSPAMGLPALPKKSFLQNKPALIGIVSALVVLIIIAAVAFDSEKEKKDDREEVQALIEQANSNGSVELNAEQTKNILDFYTSEDPNWASGAIPLQLAEGEEVDRVIAKYAVEQKLSSDRRRHLIDILKVREPKVIVEVFVDYATNGGDESTAAAALSAFTEKVEVKYLDKLVGLLEKSDSARLNSTLEIIIKRLLRESGSAEDYASKFVTGYLSTKGNDLAKSGTYLRLSAVTGSNEAKKIVEQALEEGDISAKRMAILALGGWPNDDAFTIILKSMEDPDLDGSLRKEAFDSAIEILKQDHDRSVEELEKMWTDLARVARDKREKYKIIANLKSLPGDWVLDILDFYEGDTDEDVSNKAQLAKEDRE